MKRKSRGRQWRPRKIIELSHYRFMYNVTRIEYGAAFLLVGPPGTSKTMAAYWLADKLGIPIYEYRSLPDTKPSELLFKYQVLPGNKIWLQKTPIWKAIEASREQEIVLLIDEIDKLSADAEAGLLRLLETLEFTTPFDEVVKGDIDNLIVVATSNNRRELQEETLRRFSRRIMVKFPKRKIERKIIKANLSIDVPSTFITAILDIVYSLREVDPAKAPSYKEIADIIKDLWLLPPPEDYEDFLNLYGLRFWKGNINEIKLPKIYKIIPKIKGKEKRRVARILERKRETIEFRKKVDNVGQLYAPVFT